MTLATACSLAVGLLSYVGVKQAGKGKWQGWAYLLASELAFLALIIAFAWPLAGVLLPIGLHVQAYYANLTAWRRREGERRAFIRAMRRSMAEHVKVEKGKDGQWYRAHMNSRGETISSSEGHPTRSNAIRGARDEFPHLPIRVVEDGEVVRELEPEVVGERPPRWDNEPENQPDQ